MERRKFIRYIGSIGTAFFVAPNLLSCKSDIRNNIKTTLIGANKNRGHLIRDKKIKSSNSNKIDAEFDIIIIGGGVTGLSAAYQLKKNNSNNFILFELDQKVGGNAKSEKNKYSEFPLGAHYLTLPNPDNRPLINFLKEHNIITNEFSNGKQEYSEEYLCHAPDERLKYRGVFQEGLVPNYGISEKISKEINRFFSLMNDYKSLKGNDGLYLFNIPLSSASRDKELLNYDSISFDKFLYENNFKSEELLWFLDYCCRDDFGAGLDKVSAWSGINYFAGRKSNPANTIPSNVLTWPEGNNFLINLLRKPIEKHIQTSHIVTEIIEYDKFAIISVFDCENHIYFTYKAKNVILSTPSYVTKHILKSNYWEDFNFEDYNHHPWLVTSVVLSKIPLSSGLELSWDNVKYGTKGLGYIYNQHQNYNQLKDKIVISVYLAFDREGPKKERTKMFSLTHEEMRNIVIEELKGLHNEIENYIESMSFHQWGHGMITPYPNSLKKYYEFKQINKNSSVIKLAHTDFCGYSVFEEGFSEGIETVNEILNKS